MEEKEKKAEVISVTERFSLKIADVNELLKLDTLFREKVVQKKKTRRDKEASATLCH